MRKEVLEAQFLELLESLKLEDAFLYEKRIKGLRLKEGRFGTAVTCLAFKQLGGSSVSNSGMASPTHAHPYGRPAHYSYQRPCSGGVSAISSQSNAR